MSSRKAATVSVSFERLSDLMMMPEDMTIMHVEVDHALALLNFVVTHPGLEPVREGDQIPTLIPAVTEYSRETDWGFGIVRRGDDHD